MTACKMLLTVFVIGFGVFSQQLAASAEGFSRPQPVGVYLLNDRDAGATVSKWRVANGVSARKGQFPFVTFVGFCSGSLIAPDLVLTAGHCLCHNDPSMELQVAAGIVTIAMDDEIPDDNIRTSKSIHVNPAYQKECGMSSPNDLAVVKLETPFKLTDALKPIEIDCDLSHLKPGTEVINIGFGNDDANKAGVLRFGSQHLHEPCLNVDGFICSYVKSGADVVLQHGDSGGPVVRALTGAQGNTKYVQIAVNSGTEKMASFYAPLARSCSWLKSLM